MKHLLFSVLFLAGCNYAIQHDPSTAGGAPGGGGSASGVCDPNATPPEGGLDIVTYDQLRTEVFQTKCIGCHSTASPAFGVDLSTFATARTWANEIKAEVLSDRMPRPPNPPLNQLEKDLVSAWVDSGALNGSQDQNCVPAEDAPIEEPLPPANEPLTAVPSDSELTYELVREKIFKLRCFTCHSTAGGNKSGLNLETYFNTIDEIEDIYEEVAEQMMPPPPSPALNAIERTTLLKWIELGSPQ